MKTLGIVVIVLLVMVVLALVLAIKIVKQYEIGVILWLGRVQAPRDPGLHAIVPFVDVMHRVSKRIVTMPIQSQGVVTRDSVSVDVSAVAYYRVVDAVQSVAAIENVRAAIDQIAQMRPSAPRRPPSASAVTTGATSWSRTAEQPAASSTPARSRSPRPGTSWTRRPRGGRSEFDGPDVTAAGRMAAVTLPTPTLRTPWLRLRPFTARDADALSSLQSNATVPRY